MSDVNETRYCFRCRNMAVIDPVALHGLPKVMGKAIEFLRQISMDANLVAGLQIQAENISDKLAEYAILVESVMQDG